MDREVLGARLAPLLLVGGALTLMLAALAAVAAVAFLAGRRWRSAGGTALLLPVALLGAWALFQAACVARVTVVDLSSPLNEFRARTVMSDAGATTSWSLRVEVGRPGWVGWVWTPVFKTYRDIPAEIAWLDGRTLRVRHRASTYADRLQTRVGEVTIRFEECPVPKVEETWSGPYRNGC